MVINDTYILCIDYRGLDVESLHVYTTAGESAFAAVADLDHPNRLYTGSEDTP